MRLKGDEVVNRGSTTSAIAFCETPRPGADLHEQELARPILAFPGPHDLAVEPFPGVDAA